MSKKKYIKIFIPDVKVLEQKHQRYLSGEANMMPLHCIDNDLTPMYLPLRPIHMIYDK